MQSRFLDENAGVVRHGLAIEDPHNYGISWKSEDLNEMDDNIAVGIWKRRIRRLKDPYVERWRRKMVWSGKNGRQRSSETMSQAPSLGLVHCLNFLNARRLG